MSTSNYHMESRGMRRKLNSSPKCSKRRHQRSMQRHRCGWGRSSLPRSMHIVFVWSLILCMSSHSPVRENGGLLSFSTTVLVLATDVPEGESNAPSKQDSDDEADRAGHTTTPSATTTSIPPTTVKSRRLVNQQQTQPSIVNQSTSQQSFGGILRKAAKRGIGGGIPGAIAGVIQVLTLMWLRTVVNYQSRYGTSFKQAFKILYGDGGIARFYRGLGFALIQAPLARFISTAANDGVQTFLSNWQRSKSWGVGTSTLLAAVVVGCFRILLMPIDTMKTILQVDSRDGFRNLMRRVRGGRIDALYAGALASAVSSAIAHYPWFSTYNWLSASTWLQSWLPSKLFRNAFIGLVASVVSDSMVNVFRVIKTTKQAMGSKHDISYWDTIRLVVNADGWKGLFGRGLQTRILANSLQSILFTIVWRGLADRRKDEDANTADEPQLESSPHHDQTTSGIRGGGLK